MFSRTTLLACTLALLPAAAAAQIPHGASDVKLGSLSPVATSAGPPRSLATHAPPRKDPLWNGVLIGAGIGAVAGALIGSAILECSECAGFNVPLTFGVVGAGAGAGIGAGLDALQGRRSTAPRVSVAPVVGKNVRAMVASLRF